ncbi:hypothetical protein, partial [Gemmatimonas sp.]
MPCHSRPRALATTILLLAFTLPPALLSTRASAQGRGRERASGGAAMGDSARVTAIADALWARIVATEAGVRLRTGAPVRQLPVP